MAIKTNEEESKIDKVREESLGDTITPLRKTSKKGRPSKAKTYRVTLVDGSTVYGAPSDIDPQKVENMLKEKTDEFGDAEKARKFVDALLNTFYPHSGWTLLRKVVHFPKIGSYNDFTDERLVMEYYYNQRTVETYIDENHGRKERRPVIPIRQIHKFEIRPVTFRIKEIVKEE